MTSIDETIAAVLTAHRTPIVLGTWSSGRIPQLTLHTVNQPGRRRLAAAVTAQLKAEGHDVRCIVRNHRRSAFESDACLEDFVARFAGGDVVYDPTGLVTRAGRLVTLAGTIRELLGTDMLGVSFAGGNRTIHVRLKAEAFFQTVGSRPSVQIARLRAVELRVKQAVSEAVTSDVAEEMGLKVLVGFEAPPAGTTPVDRASLGRDEKGQSVGIGRKVAAVAAMLALGFGSSAANAADESTTPATTRDEVDQPPANRLLGSHNTIGRIYTPKPLPETAGGIPMGDAPAVSELNGKAALSAGVMDDDFAGLVEASIAFPLEHAFGAQIDAAAGTLYDEPALGAGGHLFWRDPARGLVGITGVWTHSDEQDMGRAGLEGELYVDQFSASVYAGYQFGEVVDSAYVDGIVQWYASDDFVIGIGGGATSEKAYAHAGAEWQVNLEQLPGLALFADGYLSDDDTDGVMAGFRYYFGKEKSLKLRHRTDDPVNLAGYFLKIAEQRPAADEPAPCIPDEYGYGCD